MEVKLIKNNRIIYHHNTDAVPFTGKMVDFILNPDCTYLLIFGDNEIRFGSNNGGLLQISTDHIAYKELRRNAKT